MSDPEPPVSLDIIQFDQALIDAWFEISPTTNIEIGVPRVAFDALYDGVHKGYSAQLDIVTALQNLALNQPYDVEAFNKDVVSKLVAGMNSIRRFQMLIMMLATGRTNEPMAGGGDE